MFNNLMSWINYSKILSTYCLVSGTKAERGMIAWQSELGLQKDENTEKRAQSLTEKETLRMKQVRKTVYIIPYIGKCTRYIPWIKYLPFCHGHKTE